MSDTVSIGTIFNHQTDRLCVVLDYQGKMCWCVNQYGQHGWFQSSVVQNNIIDRYTIEYDSETNVFSLVDHQPTGLTKTGFNVWSEALRYLANKDVLTVPDVYYVRGDEIDGDEIKKSTVVSYDYHSRRANMSNGDCISLSLIGLTPTAAQILFAARTLDKHTTLLYLRNGKANEEKVAKMAEVLRGF